MREAAFLQPAIAATFEHYHFKLMNAFIPSRFVLLKKLVFAGLGVGFYNLTIAQSEINQKSGIQIVTNGGKDAEQLFIELLGGPDAKVIFISLTLTNGRRLI